MLVHVPVGIPSLLTPLHEHSAQRQAHGQGRDNDTEQVLVSIYPLHEANVKTEGNRPASLTPTGISRHSRAGPPGPSTDAVVDEELTAHITEVGPVEFELPDLTTGERLIQPRAVLLTSGRGKLLTDIYWSELWAGRRRR